MQLTRARTAVDSLTCVRILGNRNKEPAGLPPSCGARKDPPHQTRRFALLCCIIGVVSVHDAYLLLHNRQQILEFERNPLGRWLIELGGGDVLLFVAVKLTTTAVVCSFLVRRYRHRPRQTRCIAAGVATFQVGLLIYLLGA